jgi:hypothetical protein
LITTKKILFQFIVIFITQNWQKIKKNSAKKTDQ